MFVHVTINDKKIGKFGDLKEFTFIHQLIYIIQYWVCGKYQTNPPTYAD